MRYRHLPVLSDDDRGYLESLEIGTGTDTATVLGYLLLRDIDEEIERTAADRLETQVGTGLGRDAAIEATKELVDRRLIDTTTIDSGWSDGERKGWEPRFDYEETRMRLYQTHSKRLLERGQELATRFDPEAPVTGRRDDTDERSGLAVALNWSPNALHFPLIVGTERDHYNDIGLDITLSENPGSGSAVRSVLEGRAEVGVAGPVTVLQSILDGEPIVPVALLYQRSMVALYGLRETFDGRFESVEQLRNRRVAMAPDSETGRIAQVFLSQAGMADSVEYVHVDGEERLALADGRADAGAGVFLDPIVLRRAGYSVDSILVAADFPIPGPAIISHADILESRPEDIELFLRGTMHGWASGVRDPGATSGILDGQAEEPIHENVITELIETFGSGPSVDANGWGWQSDATWDRVVETIRAFEAAL